MSTRLTKREIEAIIDALEFALAGDDDGGPFERDTDHETALMRQAAEQASQKMKERRDR